MRSSHKTYYWDTDIHPDSDRATPVLLFCVYQLHSRKGCKPQTRSNYPVNKCYSYRSHPCRAIDQSVHARGPRSPRRMTSRRRKAMKGAWLGADSASGSRCEQACLNTDWQCSHPLSEGREGARGRG
jgi:hypothetical protein